MNPSFSDPEIARFNMIEQQIRPWDVLDPAVLDLLRHIRREDFVPQTHRHLAFVDMEVPLPEDQVMLAPKVEARLLQELNLTPTDHVLEIGAGSGFMAALLAKSALDVVTLEKYPSLKSFAESNLEKAGITNVKVVLSNGLLVEDSWAHKNFDAIVVSGAVEFVPNHLLEALSPTGRLVAIVGKDPVMQAQLIERVTTISGQTSYRTTTLFETLTRPLEDAPKVSRFKF